MALKKDFSFRGKNMEELNKLSIEEFAKLCTSRARRSLLRGFDRNLLKKIDEALKGDSKKPIRTHGRDAIVIPKMVGLTFAIHKGNLFEIVEIKPPMVGHYLGEFAMTRKRLMHGKAGIGATRSSTAISARK
ncbi:MAG: 30S ribosomal protein S19 [archaeon]